MNTAVFVQVGSRLLHSFWELVFWEYLLACRSICSQVHCAFSSFIYEFLSMFPDESKTSGVDIQTGFKTKFPTGTSPGGRCSV